MAKARGKKAGARRRPATKAKPARKSARTSARRPARQAVARKTVRKRAKAALAKRAGQRKGGPSERRKVRAATPQKAGAKTGNARPRGSSGPGTNPWPAKPSTGTGAGVSRSPYLERERRRLREVEEDVPTPPSSLDLDRSASAVRTGRQELREALHEHTETSPALTGGDVDADWQGAYSAGDETAGGDNPTPDQQRVDDIGKALGVEYQDNEELRGVDKIDGRDKKRWELNPASAEDYKERQK